MKEIKTTRIKAIQLLFVIGMMTFLGCGKDDPTNNGMGNTNGMTNETNNGNTGLCDNTVETCCRDSDCPGSASCVFSECVSPCPEGEVQWIHTSIASGEDTDDGGLIGHGCIPYPESCDPDGTNTQSTTNNNGFVESECDCVYNFLPSSVTDDLVSCHCGADPFVIECQVN